MGFYFLLTDKYFLDSVHLISVIDTTMSIYVGEELKKNAFLFPAPQKEYLLRLLTMKSPTSKRSRVCRISALVCIFSLLYCLRAASATLNSSSDW